MRLVCVYFFVLMYRIKYNNNNNNADLYHNQYVSIQCLSYNLSNGISVRLFLILCCSHTIVSP